MTGAASIRRRRSRRATSACKGCASAPGASAGSSPSRAIRGPAPGWRCGSPRSRGDEMSAGKVRVLLVDDHPVVRMGMRGLIDAQPDMTVVAEAGNGREAIERHREHRPDVTLMDLRMPELDGPEAIAAIRREQPDAVVIVLTTYDGDA